MESSYSCSSDMQSLINSFSCDKDQVNAQINQCKSDHEDKVYQLMLKQTENGSFKAVDWIALREKATVFHEREEWTSKVDEIVRKALKPNNGVYRYLKMTRLIDESVIEDVEILLQPFYETKIRKDVLEWAIKLVSLEYFESKIPYLRTCSKTMNEEEVASILRALSVIKKESLENVLKKLAFHVESTYEEDHYLRADLDGFVIADLLEVINEQLEEDDIADAIWKTKCLRTRYDEEGDLEYLDWEGHERDFIKGILTIPFEERKDVVERIKNNRCEITEHEKSCFNFIIFYYLTPDKLRDSIFNSHNDKGLILTFQKAFADVLNKRMKQGISHFVKNQLIDFIKALKLPPDSCLFDVLQKLESLPKIKIKTTFYRG